MMYVLYNTIEELWLNWDSEGDQDYNISWDEFEERTVIPKMDIDLVLTILDESGLGIENIVAFKCFGKDWAEIDYLSGITL